VGSTAAAAATLRTPNIVPLKAKLCSLTTTSHRLALLEVRAGPFLPCCHAYCLLMRTCSVPCARHQTVHSSAQGAGTCTHLSCRLVVWHIHVLNTARCCSAFRP
jgi:hypothetical protein